MANLKKKVKFAIKNSKKNMADITTGNFVCIEQIPASVGDRIVARIIDFVVIGFYAYTATVFLQNTSHFDSDMAQFAFVLIIYLPVLAYSFLAEWLFGGQTLGKYVMRTRVVMADGSSPTMGALLLRYVCEIVDIWTGCLGLVFIIATRRHQRLGDLAAGTMVIRKEDMSRMHISLSEFDYARRGFKPTYDDATRLSPRQADIVRRAVAPEAKTSQERLAGLAENVKRVLQLPADTNCGDDLKFLRTVLNDYMYMTAKD